MHHSKISDYIFRYLSNYISYVQNYLEIASQLKIASHTSPALLRLQQHKHEQQKPALNQQQLRRQQQQQQQLKPPPKIKIMYSKQKDIHFQSPSNIQHREYDVYNDTKRWVYFDARYRDPNLRFDKDIKSWVPRNLILISLLSEQMD